MPSEILQVTLEKTKAGKIPWEPTALSKQFLAAVPSARGSLLFQVGQLRGGLISLTVKDEYDNVRARVVSADVSEEEAARLRELYEEAQRQATGTKDAEAELVEALRHL
jgi:hypothetical protein